MQKRNDDKGYERGAMGISGKRGEDFHTQRYSGKEDQGVVSGSHGGPKDHSWSQLQGHTKGKG